MRSQRGFTLIELLVVIGIVAVLAAMLLASLSSAQKGSRDSRRLSDLNQYKTALAQYHATHAGVYPVSSGAEAVDSGGGPLTILRPQHLSEFPTDPLATQDYTYHSTGLLSFGMCATLERRAATMFQIGPAVSRETALAACPANGDN